MNTLDVEVKTIRGIIGHPEIDDSMDSVYGTVITGRIIFIEPVKITLDGKNWYAYAFNCNTNMIDLKDSPATGLVRSMMAFEDFVQEYDKWYKYTIDAENIDRVLLSNANGHTFYYDKESKKVTMPCDDGISEYTPDDRVVDEIISFLTRVIHEQRGNYKR